MSVELLNSNQNESAEENNFSNTDAELALIGCILWDNRNYEKVSDFLNENHFVDETNKVIFLTIKNLLDICYLKYIYHLYIKKKSVKFNK